MKITFILPAIGKKKGEKYIETWTKMEPLAISFLKGMTPQEIETEFFDDRIEYINYETETNLVVITVEMYTARRAYFISEKFRKRGIPVVMGGYHPSLVPEEAMEQCDSVVTGNGETVWGELLEDFKIGKLKKRYDGKCGFFGVMPDRKIYSDKKYSKIALIETGRGCNFNCEFCAITANYRGKCFRRPVEEVVEEIKLAGKKYIFFVDDNLVADHSYAKELAKAIEPLKVKWTTQGAITMARDEELLKLMKRSGCDVVLIGYESLNRENLKQMNKEWSAEIGERDKLTEKIHSFGIGIYATFVFGFDYDGDETFKEVLEFTKKHKFFFAAFNHLLPFPGTKLHNRLIEENRLIKDRWWLDENYCYGDIPYYPKKMSPQELTVKCLDVRKEFFNPMFILKRGAAQFLRNRDIFLTLLFFGLNMNLKKEVEGKNRLPIGSGLDEFPK